MFYFLVTISSNFKKLTLVRRYLLTKGILFNWKKQQSYVKLAEKYWISSNSQTFSNFISSPSRISVHFDNFLNIGSAIILMAPSNWDLFFVCDCDTAQEFHYYYFWKVLKLNEVGKLKEGEKGKIKCSTVPGCLDLDT